MLAPAWWFIMEGREWEPYEGQYAATGSEGSEMSREREVEAAAWKSRVTCQAPGDDRDCHLHSNFLRACACATS